MWKNLFAYTEPTPEDPEVAYPAYISINRGLNEQFPIRLSVRSRGAQEESVIEIDEKTYAEMKEAFK